MALVDRFGFNCHGVERKVVALLCSVLLRVESFRSLMQGSESYVRTDLSKLKVVPLLRIPLSHRCL